VRDRVIQLIRQLLDHKAAGPELAVRSKGETGNRRLDELFPCANTLRRTRTASSAGRSAGVPAGQVASLTRPGREMNDATSSQHRGGPHTMSCSPRMTKCDVGCLHRQFVIGYRQGRQQCEQLAEETSRGYTTEHREHLERSPLPPFKDWLVGSRRAAPHRVIAA
jgi:hypothetical protein